ncbi:MAG: hypothetical protein U5L04_06435 [Trueperaceae bacterium]|nr:hypothetical protein [Trueperaceae bacterium]
MYNFNERNSMAARGAKQIEAWLSSLGVTAKVENVEDDKQYQDIDVDLIWYTHRNPAGYKVEVKVDSYYRTGNFFFETFSNVERGTPGCFLYTEADLVFYYFPEVRRLFILPMPATRNWFVEHRERFRVRDTRTGVGNDYYTTRGCLVPRREVLAEVDDVYEYRLPK